MEIASDRLDRLRRHAPVRHRMIVLNCCKQAIALKTFNERYGDFASIDEQLCSSRFLDQRNLIRHEPSGMIEPFLSRASN
jgi:hypothetical protein